MSAPPRVRPALSGTLALAVGVLAWRLLASPSGPAPAAEALAAPTDPTCWGGERPAICVAPAWPDVTLHRPLWFGAAPGDDAHHYAVEQTGKILRLGAEGDAPATFADLSDRVVTKSNEEGLLGVAFHPDYAENRSIFFYYSVRAERGAASRLSRFAVIGDPPGRLDPESEEVLLVIPQPYGNHNGGALLFGPDGYLYLGLGDGGAGGDPHGHGQDTSTLLGSVLRLDVDAPAPDGAGYVVPPDNPLVGVEGARPEIWAWGLRNPWRMAFDPATGRLWVGDVGQSTYEEIDVVEGGRNYGWNLQEGAHCFGGDGCDPAGLTPPILEYPRSLGVSVTGGLVYRGSAIPALVGSYLFADYGSGSLWSLCADGVQYKDHVQLTKEKMRISSFGVDAAGEVIVVDHGVGRQPSGGLGRLLPAGDPRCEE